MLILAHWYLSILNMSGGRCWGKESVAKKEVYFPQSGQEAKAEAGKHAITIRSVRSHSHHQEHVVHSHHLEYVVSLSLSGAYGPLSLSGICGPLPSSGVYGVFAPSGTCGLTITIRSLWSHYHHQEQSAFSDLASSH